MRKGFYRRNKKAIQLSINFIVMLILGMAMFAGGMVFVSKFFGKAQNIKGSLDSQTERQIEAMLDSGSSFVIPIHTKEIHRKEYATYGVGLYNDGRNEAVTEFSIMITPDSGHGKDKMPLCQGTPCSASNYPQIKPSLAQTATLQIDEKYKFLFLFDIPSNCPSGTYIYNVASKQGGVEYEPGLQMIVKVV